MKQWPKEQKIMFMFSMIFLLLVTVSIVTISNTAFTENQIAGVQFSPGQTPENTPMLNELRKGYLFTIFSIVGLFFTIFYYAIMWPRRKK